MACLVPRINIETLIEEHHALLYRYAYRLTGSSSDAEDLTQQTYLIAYQNLAQLRNYQAAKSWLCTILRRHYLKHARRSISTQDWPRHLEPAEHANVVNYDEEELQHALSRLPEEYRSATILYYFQDLTYQEIATVLDVPLGTVMSRLSRGKAQLKRLLSPPQSHQPASTREYATFFAD